MDLFSESYAKDQDAQDALKDLRNQFIIPSRSDLHRKTLAISSEEKGENTQPSTYLCGNSLGLQPRLTAQYQQNYLTTWATKGVYGHFTEVEDSPLPPWLHVDDDVVEDMAAIVGAERNEVAVMQTLTGNLHFAMCSFYRPNKDRWKIIIEGKAFPSDHYAIESQLRHHSIDPAAGMIMIEPSSPKKPTLTTEQILKVIDDNASDTALLLLPGVQFYTGQFFDIETITSHAQKKGVVVGWDLAHAVGNVPLSLHDWNVDFAAWCSYKYMNCGPGSIGGLFIHSRHSAVTPSPSEGKLEYLPRLSGWWGSDKSNRFAMENRFNPIAGAGGWQLSNPSVADLTAVRASLDVFKKTSMTALREKSLKLTDYLEKLLHAIITEEEPSNLSKQSDKQQKKLEKGTVEIITPTDAKFRGAQLSLRLAPGLLDAVMAVLEREGVVVDERRPDVIRVAPAPLYNSFQDVLRFVTVFQDACLEAIEQKKNKNGSEKASVMVEGGTQDKGWSEIK